MEKNNYKKEKSLDKLIRFCYKKKWYVLLSLQQIREKETPIKYLDIAFLSFIIYILTNGCHTGKCSFTRVNEVQGLGRAPSKAKLSTGNTVEQVHIRAHPLVQVSQTQAKFTLNAAEEPELL